MVQYMYEYWKNVIGESFFLTSFVIAIYILVAINYVYYDEFITKLYRRGD